MKNRFSPIRVIYYYSLLIFMLIISGCTTLDTNDDSASTEIVADQPYYPIECKEILVPGGLKVNRDKSMFINTHSFKGGYLRLSGRLEVNSLTDFFINSMEKNGWRRNGTAKYKDVLLAFSKKSKTCIIIISETSLGINTEVSIYITETVGDEVSLAPSAPVTLNEENIIQ